MPSPLVYGLTGLEAYRDRSVSAVGVNVINEAAAEAIRAFNAAIDQFISTVAQRNEAWNTSPINQYELAQQVDMQPVDEKGIAKPVQPYTSYQIGLPLYTYELAMGETWEANRVKTVEEVNRDLLNLFQADRRALLRGAMRALFYNAGWTFTTRNEDKRVPASIPILPLANGDSQQYGLKTLGTETAQRYNAQNAQPSDANDPFPAIYERMTRFIDARPRPRLVAFVNGSNLVSGILGLTDFTPVLDSRFRVLGSDVTQVTDSIQSELYFGDKVLGEHAVGITVVRWNMMPENYILTMNVDEMPLGYRESPHPELRGLYSTTSQGNYGNEIMNRFRRKAGFGVVNRLGADIVYTGGASYVVPAGYTPIL